MKKYDFEHLVVSYKQGTGQLEKLIDRIKLLGYRKNEGDERDSDEGYLTLWNSGEFNFGESPYPEQVLNSTYEEFMERTEKYVSNLTYVYENLNVKASDVLKIHEIADYATKQVISGYLSRINEKGLVWFTDSEIDELFENMPTEKETLVSIFGERLEVIDWDKIKTGSRLEINWTKQFKADMTDDMSVMRNFEVDVVFWKEDFFIGNMNGIIGGTKFGHCSGKGWICTLYHRELGYLNFIGCDGEEPDFVRRVIHYEY